MAEKEAGKFLTAFESFEKATTFNFNQAFVSWLFL